MKFKNIIYFILLSVVMYSISGCGDRALFDELATNRVKIVFKGTYESNNPRLWTNNFSVDDSVYIYPDPEQDADPDLFMLDIAGLKVATGSHSQYFANYRETYKIGLNDSEPFFNGTGILYENDDIRPDFVWNSIQIYFRKMIFNSAREYVSQGFNNWGFDNTTGLLSVLFHEEDTYGLDFNQMQVLTYYDYLLTNYKDINRIFPFVINMEDGFIFDYDQEETVLEIRFVVKNFIKKYEYDYSDSEHYYVRHFFALSDWLRDVKKDEVVKGLCGGNILAVARYYVKGLTATITGDAGDNNCYVVAIGNNHDISEYELGNRTRPDCDEPKSPRVPVALSAGSSETVVSSYIDSVLDYYLEYEKYKEIRDNFVDCVNSGLYETEWNDYNAEFWSYKIPPHVTWVGDSNSTFNLTEVPVGESYKIYRSIDGTGPGELPGSFFQIGNVEVSADEASNVVTVE